MILLVLPGQGVDPLPPAGGFAITEKLDQIVSFQDGGRTRIDVRYPTAPPGTTGWPVAVVVHGLGIGINRKTEAGRTRFLASRGYFVATYDVRGQGDFKTLTTNTNLGTTIVGKPERLDFVEVVNYLKTTYGSGAAPDADLDRLGVAGRSQGGIHAWAAAAWSGKPLPANSRGLTRFPVIKAACPSMFPPFTSDVVFPQGKSVHSSALAALFLLPVARFEASFEQTLQGLIMTGQYGQAAAFIDGEPFRQDLQQLQTSKVPVFAQFGWNDSWSSPALILRALAQLPASTPQRLSFNPAIAHDVPGNDAQIERHDLNWDRWFARFLKGENNAVDREASVVSGLRQESEAEELDPTSRVWTRHHDTWPPARGRTDVYYLRANQALSVTKPTGAESPDTVTHQVPSSFTMQTFLSTVFTLPGPTMSNFVPLSSRSYDTSTFSAEAEIAGTTNVRLFLTPKARNFQVHCALFRVKTPPARGLDTSQW